MPKSREDITLYGERAEQFREIRDDLAEYLGHKPSKAAAVGLVMSNWESPEESL